MDELRQNLNWSVYQLAKEAGLTQSTLANMFSRKSVPSIATLEQICSAFNITLSEFFAENNNEYSQEEQALIHQYRKLGKKEQTYVQKIVNIMS